MKMTGNTILITGGASGIGRGLAEAFHKLGNHVIIAGRRQAVLDEVTKANPGMKAIAFDIADEAGVKSFAARVVKEFPALNVLVNNAGIMQREAVLGAPDYLTTAEDTITTNLLGPIRLTAALLPHLLTQAQATVMNTTSGLAFVPLALTPTYSASKAALHSYTMSLRHQLKGTSVEMVELAPPYVQTELTGEHQKVDPRAMPLADYLAEVMEILAQPGVTEVIVERCKPLRFAAENGNLEAIFEGLAKMDE